MRWQSKSKYIPEPAGPYKNDLTNNYLVPWEKYNYQDYSKCKNRSQLRYALKAFRLLVDNAYHSQYDVRRFYRH